MCNCVHLYRFLVLHFLLFSNHYPSFLYSIIVSIPSQTLLTILLHLFTPCCHLFLVSILSAPRQASSSLHHFLHQCLHRYLLTILTNLHLHFSSFSATIPPVSSTFFCLFVFLAFLPPLSFCQILFPFFKIRVLYFGPLLPQ